MNEFSFIVIVTDFYIEDFDFVYYFLLIYSFIVGFVF